MKWEEQTHENKISNYGIVYVYTDTEEPMYNHVYTLLVEEEEFTIHCLYTTTLYNVMWENTPSALKWHLPSVTDYEIHGFIIQIH